RFELRIHETMPSVHHRERRDAAEAVLLFHHDHTRPETGGTHRGKNSSATTTEHADIGFMNDRSRPAGLEKSSHRKVRKKEARPLPVSESVCSEIPAHRPSRGEGVAENVGTHERALVGEIVQIQLG